MRAREFIFEVKLGPGGTVDTQQYGSSAVDQRGPGLSLPRDEKGRPIEPGLEQPLVGPEDIIGLGAPTATKALGKLAQKGSNLVQKGIQKAQPYALGLDITRPAVKNQLYDVPYGGPSFKQGSTQMGYNMRGVSSQKEIDDIKLTGYVNPKAGLDPSDPGHNTKYWVHTDQPQHMPHHGQAGTIRVPSSKTPVGRAVSSKDVEKFNQATGTWDPLIGTVGDKGRRTSK